MAITDMSQLKIVLREDSIPFFSDDELDFYLKKNDGSYNNTAYECLLVKSQNLSLNVSGLQTGDWSKYFYMLAGSYKPNNTGVLGE